MQFRIVTDTSANLPSELLEQHGIPVIPFSYYVNGGEEANCLDTRKFNGKRFYDQIRAGARVTTSQITPQRYIDTVRPYLENGEDILFISMSSGISGSFHCSELAKEELAPEFPERKIMLIDTLGASLGEGIPVLRAVECREKGMSIEETTEFVRTLCDRICQVFTVDDLMYLRKGGRLSNMKAIVGTMLRIKPLLKGNERGQIVSFAKCRGRKHSIQALAERYDMFVKDPGEQIVGIAHADCEEDANYLISLLNKNNPPKEILTVCYEPVTGSHVGPDTLALFFEAVEGVRTKCDH